MEGGPCLKVSSDPDIVEIKIKIKDTAKCGKTLHYFCYFMNFLTTLQTAAYGDNCSGKMSYEKIQNIIE